MSLQKKLKDKIVDLVKRKKQRHYGSSEGYRIAGQLEAYNDVFGMVGVVADQTQKITKDTKVDILEMFCYQGPPTKRWIETKGQFWEGWNAGCGKISEKVLGLLVDGDDKK